MSFMRVKAPDFMGATHQSEDILGEMLKSYHPSTAMTDEEQDLQNKLANQSFQSGLSGSTLEASALGRGETEALSQDQQQYVHELLGLEPQVSRADTAASAANRQIPLQLAGAALGGASKLLPMMTGSAAPAAGGIPSVGASGVSPVVGTSPVAAQGSGAGGFLSQLLSNPQALMALMGAA
jgi:hypothetical protein